MLTDAESAELDALYESLPQRIDEVSANDFFRSHTDFTAACQQNDLDALRAMDKHFTGRHGTRVIVHVIDILRAHHGIHEVAPIITTDMLESLLQISTAMAVAESPTVENTRRVCAMVVPHVEREAFVVSLIRQRKITDADEIQELIGVMESGSRALAEGIL
jgi:hypothetical protein